MSNGSGISFQGVGSGLPVQKMIDAIMKVRQRPIAKADAQVKQYNNQISDLGKLSNLLSSFRTSLDPFRVLKTAFKEQFAVQNSNEDLITVTKKAGYAHKSSTANFKLLGITNPSAQKNWTWASQKVIADYHYKGTMTMEGQTIDFTDKAGGYTLDEMVAKINDSGLKNKVTAKKILVNEHTDPSKNTYSLRIESKVGGQAGTLTSPTFTANAITNPNSTGGTTSTTTITGGNHITNDASKLNSRNPTYTIDLGSRAGNTHITVFNKNNNKSVFDRKSGASGIDGFFANGATSVNSNDGNYTLTKITATTARITVNNLTDSELASYKPAGADKITAWIGQGEKVYNGVAAHPWNSANANATAQRVAFVDNSPDNSKTQPTASNMIQPNIRDRWNSTGIATGATITEDTKLNINGTEFNLKNKTLADVVTEINASALSANVTASVTTNSGVDKLTITSNSSGTSGYMNIKLTHGSSAPAPTNPVNNMVTNNQASIMSNLDEKDLQIRFSVNGQVYTRNSYDLDTSKIAGLEGVEVKIKANAGNVTNKEATIVTTKDAAETKKHTKKSVQAFVNAYNNIVEFVNTQTQVSVKGKKRYAGSLQGDNTLKSILQSLETEFAKATGGDLKHSLAMMGIMHVKPKKNYSFGSLDKDAGKLEIKDDLFTKALNSGSLEKTFAGYTNSSGVKVKGYADRFNELTKWMTSGFGSNSNFTGLINMRKKTIESQLKNTNNKIENMKMNLADYQKRLVRQFNLADTISAKMNRINSMLLKQLGNASLIKSAMGGKK